MQQAPPAIDSNDASYISPADLPFEQAPSRPSLAPRMVRDLDARHRPPDPERQRRGRRNRRVGNAAQREWAKLIGAENVGALGGEDGRQPCMLWEVKSWGDKRRQPGLAFIEAALDQVAVSAVRRHLPYGLAIRLPDRPVERRWLVVLRSPEWLELPWGAVMGTPSDA